MSQNIDTNVVEMRFDNRQFEKNVKESMSTIDKLKASLNFSGASKSFNQITEAANKVSFKGLEKSVDNLSDHISLKAAAMFTVVNNMVTQIQSQITNMVKQFTIVPISTGFEEYELKMGSVQTIMAATGESLETVNAYLQELNEYSDKTIYSFSDMTQNIGKFTNAGVKLEDAVLAMKGISNEAAISGANANEASRAMYNLAQSLSMGYVQYIDWKSIENANMATVAFKENLADMAVQLGVIQKTSDGYFQVAGKSYNLQQLFKDALKEQWLTTDVLIGTLRDYADETTEIGKKAYAAAQDVKTFTMMMDTLKEAAQSGWAYTWEIFIGDFEEAKQLFTRFSKIFGKMIDDAADARNTLLRSVLGSRWDKLTGYVEAAGISVEEFEGRLTRVLRDAGIPIDDMIKQWGSLGKAITHIGDIKDYIVKVIKSFSRPIVETGEAVQDVTAKLDDFQKVVNQVIRGEFGSGKKRVEELTKAGWNYAQVQGLVNKIWERNGHTWKDTTISAKELVEVIGELSDEEKRNLGFTEEQIAAYDNLMVNIEDLDSDFWAMLNNFTKPTGRELIFDSISNVVTALIQRFDILKEAWSEVFPAKASEELYGYIEAFNKFTKWLILDEDKADKLKRTLRGLFSIVGLISDIITTALRIFFPGLIKSADALEGGLLGVTAAIGDVIYGFREFLKENDGIAPVLAALARGFIYLVGSAVELVKEIANLPIVKDILESIMESLKKFAAYASEVFGNFYDDMMDGATAGEALSKIFQKIYDKLKKITKLLPSIEELKQVYADMVKDFENGGANIIVGLIVGLGEGIKAVVKIITNIANKIVDVFKDILGIHSPSTVFIWIGAMIIAGLAVGIAANFGKITGIFTIFTSFVKKKGMSVVLAEILKYATESIKKYTGVIIELLQTFKTNFGVILGKIRDTLANSDIMDPVMKIATDLLKLLILFKTFRFMDSVGEGIEDFGEGVKKIGKAFQTVGRGIKDFFKSLAAKNYAKVIEALALSLTLLIGTIFLISKVVTPQDIENARNVLELMKDLMIYFGVLAGAIIVASGIMTSKWVDGSLKNVSNIILSLAVFAVALGGAAWLLAQAATVVATIPRKDYYQAMNALDDILKTMTAFVLGLGFLSIFSKSNLIGIPLAILAMGYTIKMIVDIIRDTLYYESESGMLTYDGSKADGIRKGFKVLSTIIWTMAAALALIGAFSQGGIKYIGVASAFLGIAASLHIVILAIKMMDLVISSLEHPIASFFSLAVIIVVMGIVVGLMADLVSMTPARSILAVGVLFLAFAVACNFVAGAVRQLNGVTIDERVANMFGVIITIMFILITIVTIMSALKTSAIPQAAGEILAMSVLLIAISASIAILAKIIKEYDIGALITAAGALVILVFAISALLKSMTALSGMNAFGIGGILAIAIAIGVLAYSIYELQKIDANKIETIAWALGGVLVAALLASMLAPKMIEAAAAIIAVAAAIFIVAEAIKVLGGINPEQLVQGIIGVAVAVMIAAGAFYAFLGLMSLGTALTWPAIVALLAVAAVIAAITWAIVELASHKDEVKAFFGEIVDWLVKVIEKTIEAIEYLIRFANIFNGSAPASAAIDIGNSARDKEIESNMLGNGGYRSSRRQGSSSSSANPAPQAPPAPEPEYTEETVVGTYAKRASAPTSKETATITNEAKKTGELVAETIGTTVVESDSTKTAALDYSKLFMGYIQQTTEQYAKNYGGGFNLSGTANAIAGSLSDSSKGIFGNVGENMSMDTIMGMKEALESGDYTSLMNMYGAGYDSAGYQDYFKELGNYMGDLTAEGYMEGLENMDFNTALNMLYGNLSEASSNSSYWDSKIGPNGTVIPIYSAGQAASVAPSGFDFTSLLGNNALGNFNQTVQFPDTMNTTSPDVVEAVKSLKQDIHALGTSIANLYVRLDTGTIVGQLTPEINKTMGRMAAYHVRGI